MPTSTNALARNLAAVGALIAVEREQEDLRSAVDCYRPGGERAAWWSAMCGLDDVMALLVKGRLFEAGDYYDRLRHVAVLDLGEALALVDYADDEAPFDPIRVVEAARQWVSS